MFDCILEKALREEAGCDPNESTFGSSMLFQDKLMK